MQKKRRPSSPSFIDTVCPLCHKHNADYVMYEQNFAEHDVTSATFSARRLPDKLHYRMVKCGHDTMVRSNPILHPKHLQMLYAKSAFTYQQEVANLIRTYAGVLEPVLSKMHKNDAILEVGCGNGFMLEYLRKQGFTNVRGVEPSSDAVAKAPTGIKKKITRAVFTRSLFKPKSFDLILVFQTLDHIPQPDKFVNDCAIMLKPGGLLLSVHHNVESMSAVSMGEKSPIFDIEHTQLFSKKTSMMLFQNAGLTVETLKSPSSVVSLRHLVWLFPLPVSWKRAILGKKATNTLLSSLTMALQLGNVLIIGRKSA